MIATDITLNQKNNAFIWDLICVEYFWCVIPVYCSVTGISIAIRFLQPNPVNNFGRIRLREYLQTYSTSTSHQTCLVHLLSVVRPARNKDFSLPQTCLMKIIWEKVISRRVILITNESAWLKKTSKSNKSMKERRNIH